MLDRELWDLVARVGTALAPGTTTSQIDMTLARGLAAIGAKSTFPSAGYPCTNSISVEEEIANGIPSRHRMIAAGQLVKLDTAARRDGAFATAAWTFRIGGGDDPLVDAGRAALRAAIAQLRVGARTGDVGAAIQSVIEGAGFAVVRTQVGYAIVNGEPQSPQLPCFGTANTGKRLQAGQRFAIHVLAHSGTTETMRDKWTLVTDPGRRGVVLTATVEVGEQAGVVVGAFPGFADLR